jgi:hypothetical protein
MAGASPRMQGLVYGAVSAVTELGIAALFLFRAQLTLPNALAFGAGIGAFEIFFTIGVGLLQGLAEPSPASFAGRFAFIGHVASRLLIYASVARCQFLPAVIAFGTFAAIDGAASSGIAAGWDWNSDTTMTHYLTLAAIIGVLEAAAALYFARQMPQWRGNRFPTAPASAAN